MAQFCLVHRNRDKFFWCRSTITILLSLIVVVVNVQTSRGPLQRGWHRIARRIFSG